MKKNRLESTPNDPNLSDTERRHDACAAGLRGAGGVTERRVRCSALLGDVELEPHSLVNTGISGFRDDENKTFTVWVDGASLVVPFASLRFLVSCLVHQGLAVGVLSLDHLFELLESLPVEDYRPSDSSDQTHERVHP